jgi:hypothetical protein
VNNGLGSGFWGIFPRSPGTGLGFHEKSFGNRRIGRLGKIPPFWEKFPNPDRFLSRAPQDPSETPDHAWHVLCRGSGQSQLD